MAWGFFDSIFEQKEYGEAYVLEKLAREMMAKDPKLKAEFERKVETDPRFAANPAAQTGILLRPLALGRLAARALPRGAVGQNGYASAQITQLISVARRTAFF